jgi:hypothetical protein
MTIFKVLNTNFQFGFPFRMLVACSQCWFALPLRKISLLLELLSNRGEA